MTNYLRKKLSFPLEEEVEERLSFEAVKVHDILHETREVVVVVAVLTTTVLCTYLKCNLWHVRWIRQRNEHCLLKPVLADELDS